MRSKQNVTIVGLILLLVVVVYGIVRTGGDQAAGATLLAAHVAGDSLPPVDEHSLETAQLLVRQPTTPDERTFAEDALRLADKEMDLAFADAVRDVALHPAAANPKVDEIAARLHAAEAEFLSDSAEVDQLAAQAAHAAPADRANAADRLSLGRAHLELVQDEVDDARDDLVRAGGDPQGRMQAMMDEHEALSRSSDSTRVALVPRDTVRGLVRHAQAWLTMEQKRRQLARAKVDAESLGVVFARRHNQLEGSAHAADHDSVRSSLSHAASTALLLETQRQAVAQKTRGTLDQHVDNQHGLADVYGHWIEVLHGQQRREVNRMLAATAVIVCIVLLGLLLDRWFEHLLGRTAAERRRTHTLYMVLRVTIQAFGALLVLLVVFGKPANLGTVLGLAGAGLTVALKDFILGFCGWFVLMGRDGMAIGDLVEINGVTGEVLEVGMLHTVLLETGNWADSGQLTGRRVSFGNSFAIEKHYFNFSTNGRWLWDDVRFVVPTGRDPAPIVEAMQRQVEALTADGASRAEHEMKGVRRAPRGHALTTAPSINIKPIVGGVEVSVRYLTHVRERADLRSRLYEAVIALLHGTPPALAAGPAR